MEGSKGGFALDRDGASSKSDRKSANSGAQNTSKIKRTTVRRSKIFKSDNWYGKAALSIKISGKSVTNIIQTYVDIEK